VGYLESYGIYSKFRLDVLLGYCDGRVDMGNVEDHSAGECLSPALLEKTAKAKDALGRLRHVWD